MQCAVLSFRFVKGGSPFFRRRFANLLLLNMIFNDVVRTCGFLPYNPCRPTSDPRDNAPDTIQERPKRVRFPRRNIAFSFFCTNLHTFPTRAVFAQPFLRRRNSALVSRNSTDPR